MPACGWLLTPLDHALMASEDAGDHVPPAIANVAQAFPRGSATLALP